MRIRNSQKIFQSFIFDVEKTFFDDADKLREYDLIKHPGGCAILPIIEADKILLISQFRPAVNKVLLEVPAGILEKGEDPRKCALRELQEETGYSAKKLYSLGAMLTSPGILDETIHLFIAEDLFEDYKECDEDEKIDKKIVLLADALEMIDDGSIQDAKTSLLLMRYAIGRQTKKC